MRNRNIIFAFFGGVMIGSAATYGILYKMGKVPNLIDQSTDATSDSDSSEIGENAPRGDKPSFDTKEKVDTFKIDYTNLTEKPDLDSLVSKYNDDEETEEEEEEDTDEEDDEEATDEEDEISEALVEHALVDEPNESDEYGHYITKLDNGLRDSLIYLISEEYLGEIYSVEDLVYYENDDVLCDVLDAPVVNLARVVGPALEHFGEFDDPDKVYIRNCHMGFEYEITRKHEAFGAHIYGVNMDEKESPKKRPRRPQEDEE